MKKNTIWLLALLAIMFGGGLSAQDAKVVDLGIFKNPKDHSIVKVKLRPAQDVSNGSYSAGIFTVRMPSEYGASLTAVSGTSPYGYTFAGPVGNADGYDYYRFQFSGSVHFVNWERNIQYPVLTLKVNGNTPLNARIELVTDNEWTRQHNGDYYQELLGQELERDFYFLPLNVKGFQATPTADQGVELNWELENEEMLAYSEIEYAVNGQDFNLIGKVAALGDPEAFEEAYSHLHDQPTTVNYYRIRLTDINGEITYTPVRVVYLDDAGNDFAVFPNPTSGLLTIASRNLIGYPAGVSYQVSDNSGKILWTDQIRSDNSKVSLSHLPAGAYIVKIFSSEEQLDKFKVILANN
jgi:hypothetical protein